MAPVYNGLAQLTSGAKESLEESAREGKLPETGSRGTTQPITPTQISLMYPAKLFKEAVKPAINPAGSHLPSHLPKRQITHVTFEYDGRKLITCGEDDGFSTYDCLSGKRTNTLGSNKYGISNITATHTSGNIVHASTRVNDDIRYHSAHDNKYLRYFKGHTGRVESLSMNPTSDILLSGSQDSTVLMWDLRAPEAKGKLNDMGSQGVIVSWDTTGTIFAVGHVEAGAIALYSVASFDKAPFIHGSIIDPKLAQISTPPRRILMTSLSFSTNAKYILVGTSSDVHYVIDAFSLQVVARLVGHSRMEQDRNGQYDIAPRKGLSGAEVTWSPDSQYVFSGSYDGKIYVYHIKPPAGSTDIDLLPPIQPPTGPPSVPAQDIHPIQVLDPAEVGASGQSRVVAFNPKYCHFVSAGNELAFWIPKRKEEEKEEDEEMNMDMGDYLA